MIWPLHFKLLIALTLAVALFASSPLTPARACTPPPGGLPNYTATDRTTAAPIVIEGTVVAVDGANYQTAVVQVTRYFKGGGPELIAINGYGPSSLCLTPVSYGQVGVFYLSGDEANGYYASYLSQFDAIDPNDQQTVSDVIAASGQQPSTNFTPYQAGTPDAIMTQAMAPLITPVSLTPTPYIPYQPPSFIPFEVIGSLGLGCVIGLVIGLALGLLIGFTFKQKD